VTAARSDYDIVGIGVATLDVISVVDDFPHGEEVRQARAIVMQGGGPVATAVAAAAQLGADTAMLDALGDDSQGGLVRVVGQGDLPALHAVLLQQRHHRLELLEVVPAQRGAYAYLGAAGVEVLQPA